MAHDGHNDDDIDGSFGEVIADKAYFALSIEGNAYTITDSAVTDKFTVHGNTGFTVEIWVQPFERTDLDETSEILIARRVGFWELGLTGHGRAFAKLIYTDRQASSSQRMEFRLLTPKPVEVGSWMYLSMSVAPDGQLQLFNEGDLLVEGTAPGEAITNPAVGGTAPIGYIELGGNDFQGRIRNLLISDIAKDATKNRNTFAQSMFHISSHHLPDNGLASLNLGHVSETDTHDPQPHLIPLCCLYRQSAGQDPGMLTIQLPDDPAVQLQSLTSARRFILDGHVDCGLKALPDLHSFTFDTWFMPRAANDRPLVQDGATNPTAIFTLCSVGEVSPYNDAKIHGDAKLAPFSIALVVETKGTQRRSFYHIRMPQAPDRPWIGGLNMSYPDVAKWSHIAVSVDSAGVNVFLDGQLIGDRHDWVLQPQASNVNHQYPLLLGASCTKWDPERHAARLPMSTQANWLGYIKLARIWKRTLSEFEVKELYDPTFEPQDMAMLDLYADLNSPVPADTTQRNEIRCSAQTEYQEDVVCRVEPAHVMTTMSRLVKFHVAELAQVQAQEEISVMSSGASENDDTPFFQGLLDQAGEWFELLDCAAAVIFIVIDTLAGLKVKKAKLANVFYKFFGKKGVQAAGMLQKLFAAAKEIRNAGVGPLVNGAIDFAYFIHDSGVLKEILSCFTVSFFGVLKLLKRFIPWVGWAALAADLTLGAIDIGFAIERYVRRTQAKQQPLALLWNPDPRTEKFLIDAGGSTLKFSALLDHRPADSQNFALSMSTEPANVLSLSSKDILLSQDNWQSGVDIAVQASKVPADGQARILSADGTVLISFKVIPVRTLEFVQDIITARVGTGGSTYDLDYELVWTGPGDEEPDLKITVFDKGDKELKVVKRRADTEISQQSPITGKRVRKQTGSVSVPSSTGQPAKVVATGFNALTATIVTKVAGVDEYVTIYMCNAGSGDAFYIHYKKVEEKVQGTNTVKEEHQATMIIDGGSSKDSANNMWTCVAGNDGGIHLPQLVTNVPAVRRAVDLVMLSHQDDDHVEGIVKMYNQMALGKPVDGSRKGVFTGADTLKPANTWLNPPVPLKFKRSVSNIDALSLDLHQLTMSGVSQGDPVTGDDAEEVTSLPTTRTKEWVYELLGSAQAAQDLADICTAQRWAHELTPLLATAVPKAIVDAGGRLTNLGPNDDLLTDSHDVKVKSTKASQMANNVSIVEDMSGQTYTDWHALWTGDAGCKADYGIALQTALGIATPSGSSTKVEPLKHYLLMKVPHHASEVSNSAAFFAAVTADHYLISGNGGSENPRQQCIQWILDGHAAMRAVAAANSIDRKPPKIWVNNPLPQDFVFDYQDGEVYCRNSATPGDNYSRDLKDGCLIFQIYNGAVIEPKIIAAPSTDSADRNKALAYTNKKRSVRSTADPTITLPPWVPLYPYQLDNTTTDEWTDIRTHKPSMYANRITCSPCLPAQGQFTLSAMDQPRLISELESTFQSDTRNEYTLWPRAFLLTYSTTLGVRNLASITTDRDPGLSTSTNGGESDWLTLPDRDSRVMGVTFYCPVQGGSFQTFAIQALVLQLQDGRTVSWPTGAQMPSQDAWIKTIPSPGEEDFALVGFRYSQMSASAQRFSWGTAPAVGGPAVPGANVVGGREAFITRLGAIWKRR